MTLDREALDRAVREGVLSAAQADALWARASPEPSPPALASAALAAGERSALAAVAGAGALAAAILLEVWEHHGAGPALAATLALGAGFALGARRLHLRPLPAAASVAAALATVAAPVAVRAVQQLAGTAAATEAPVRLDQLLASPSFAPATAWAAAVLLALQLLRAPLLSAALVASGWVLAMAAAPLAFGPATTWDQRGLLSAVVGYLALTAGLVVDRRTRRDHAGWLYLAGLAAFWGGLTSIRASGSLVTALGVAGNLLLVVAALALRRRAFAVLGAIGAAGALGHLAEATLDARAVPVVLAALGAALFAGVLVWARRAPAWERALSAALPDWGRRLLPPWPR